jgi:hypothetical protein
MSPPHSVCESPGQTAHFRTLGSKLGASALNRRLADVRVKIVLFISFLCLFSVSFSFLLSLYTLLWFLSKEYIFKRNYA